MIAVLKSRWARGDSMKICIARIVELRWGIWYAHAFQTRRARIIESSKTNVRYRKKTNKWTTKQPLSIVHRYLTQPVHRAHYARVTFSVLVKIVVRAGLNAAPSDARSTLTVSPDLLALVVESGTLAHVTETVGDPAAARAAILLVHVGRTLACVSGAVFRQVAFVVGRPTKRPHGQKLSNKTSVSTDSQANPACFDYRRVLPSKKGKGYIFYEISLEKCRTGDVKLLKNMYKQFFR